MKTSKALLMMSLLILLNACAGGSGGGNDSLSSTDPGGQTYTPPGGDGCYGMDTNSCAAFKATNTQRIAYGLSVMSYCQACYNMAAEQSQDMAVRGYFDHTRPDETFAHRATRFGLGAGVAENIAAGKVGAPVVNEMWMNSSGHRANILNPSYKSFAVGTYGTYSTQVFYVGTNK